MAVLDQLKKYFKMLPVQLTIVNQKAAQIADDMYQVAIEKNSFAENEAFNSTYGNRLKKYIVYYDIGKCELQCSDIKINRTSTEHEMLANRKTMTILEELFRDAQLTAEEQICKEILYYATERNEQFDGMGFPKCLKGENISPIGRILSVAEYVARKYIDCTEKNELIKKLKLKIGKKFDATAVELAIIVIEQLYEREKAEIPDISEEFRSIRMLYQPVCDATKGVAKENAGFICLNDPKLGTVMPSFYAPVAERNGRIMDITKFGFEMLFQDMASSKFADATRPRTFSVSVSAECLSKSTFMAFVKKLIRDYYVNPQKLTLEIDATALDLYDAKLAETLKGYKELGFKLAIDNYGVDNASLLKLQEMEFDTIKIGNGFIDKICENRKTYEIVKNIIKMARDLNIGIVAKGVDTTQQKEYLLDLKCLYMQGRVFGEPGYLSI